MKPCINLRRVFGRRYKVVYDPIYYAELGADATREEPQLMRIPCMRGYIRPFGTAKLAACASQYGPITDALWKLPFIEIVGSEAVFSPTRFAAVATIMGPQLLNPMPLERRRELAKFKAMIGRLTIDTRSCGRK